MALKIDIETFGKQDQFKLAAEDLVTRFSGFTGRKDRNPQDVEDMVQSLLAQGQINPITYRKNDNAQVVVVTGHTRILAAVEINKRRLVGYRFNEKGEKIEVQYGPDMPFRLKADFTNLSAVDAMFATFTENDGDQRKPLTPVDIAFFIETVASTTGMQDNQIAVKLGKKASWVSQHRTVGNLDAATKAEISAGNMSLAVAVGPIAAVPTAAARAAVVAKTKHDNEGELTVPGVRKAIEELGVETTKVLPRSVKVQNQWLDKAINSVPEGDPRQKFLLAFSDFRKGIVSEADLDEAFEALSPTSEAYDQVA